MKRKLVWLLSASLAMASSVFANVSIQTEQLNPADPSWSFKSIPRPSKSEIATEANVTVAGNKFEPAGPIRGPLTVTLPTGLKAPQAQPVNLRGEKTGEPLPIADGKLAFPLPPYTPASFILH